MGSIFEKITFISKVVAYFHVSDDTPREVDERKGSFYTGTLIIVILSLVII